MMGIELTFEIVFKSNYHVGAGYGKGFNVDSAILRDGDGVPVIRGSTLAGLLRDGVHRLFQTSTLASKQYSMETDDVEKNPVARLFGSSAYPKRWYIGSARPRDLLPKKRDAQAAQRARIDPRTRRAAPRKLFSQEEGLAGQAFTFTITCPDSGDSALDEAALLVAAARFVRQLGRSRRRGLGECLFQLTDTTGFPEEVTNPQDWLLERFRANWLEGSPDSPLKQGRESFTVGEHVPVIYQGTPVRLRLIVRLDEPLLIARRAPAGNQFESRASIPGTVILGALAGEAARHEDLTDAGKYAQFVSLFMRDGMVFPTLYPAFESESDIYPSIPVPLGLFTCSIVPFQGEDEGHGLYLGVEGHQECPHDHCDGKLEPIGDYMLLSDDRPYTLSVESSSELHIQVDEKSGRVKEGQLYGYTVLDAGQYFVGELLCAGGKAWGHLQEMTGIAEETPLEWRLGKARRRGYGKVTAWLERCDDKEPVWIQLPLDERVADVNGCISLTLLTDTIIANRWGQQAVGFAENWLEETLGLGKVRIVDAYARSRVVDSFNSYLGLPRWRDTALTAGSVVWFALTNPPGDWRERMKALEREGIGLRRNEGFGRVAFNHPIYDQRNRLTESNITLRKPLRPAVALQADRFVKKWKETLDDLLPKSLPKKMEPLFTALARWLHTHSDQSPDEILKRFNARFEDGKCKGVNLQKVFGEPDDALIEAIGGKSEYGARSKDNFFLEEGRKTMLKICGALRYLEGKEQRYWAEGIAILADRIAAIARSEKGETR